MNDARCPAVLGRYDRVMVRREFLACSPPCIENRGDLAVQARQLPPLKRDRHVAVLPDEVVEGAEVEGVAAEPRRSARNLMIWSLPTW